MPRLIIARGPDQGKVYQLTADVVTIGRGRKNDIIIHDNEVSREHCRLVKVLEHYEIHDLKSSNGTFVNGHPVDERGWLADSKCIIELGDSITLEYLPDDVSGDTEGQVVDTITNLTDHQYYLVVKLRSQPEPAIYPLDSTVVGIGRSLENDIVIQAPEMSRQHLRLTLTQDGYLVEDLKSLNGTSVNGHRLYESTLLRLNDTITVGAGVEIKYTGKPEDLTSVLQPEMPNLSNSEEMVNTRRSIDVSPHLTTQSDSDHSAEVGHGLEHGDLEGHVLIAYAQEDWSGIVGELFTQIQDSELPVWVDQYLSYGSDAWKHAVEQALSECALLVAVVSPQSMARDYVRRAIRYFLNREKPVVIFHYRDVVDPLPISVQKLPAVWYNSALAEESFRKLIVEVKRTLHPT